MHLSEVPISAAGSLYLAQFENKIIKIGISNNPRSRLRNLNNGKDGAIKKLHLYPCLSPAFVYRIERICLAHFCGAGVLLPGGWERFQGIAFLRAKRIIDSVLSGIPKEWFLAAPSTASHAKIAKPKMTSPNLSGESMNKSTAVKKAKSAYRLAKMLGISRQAVSKWRGQIPSAQEAKLRELRPDWFSAKAHEPHPIASRS